MATKETVKREASSEDLKRIFANITREICARHAFTFSVDENGALTLSVPEFSGTYKVMLPQDPQGRAFVATLQGHKNCRGAELSGNFTNVRAEEAPVKVSKGYTKGKARFYFDLTTALLLEDQTNIDLSDKNISFGTEVFVDAFPDLLFLFHPGKWQGASVVVAGKLITAGPTTGKDKIAALVDRLASVPAATLARNLEALNAGHLVTPPAPVSDPAAPAPAPVLESSATPAPTKPAAAPTKPAAAVSMPVRDLVKAWQASDAEGLTLATWGAANFYHTEEYSTFTARGFRYFGTVTIYPAGAGRFTAKLGTEGATISACSGAKLLAKLDALIEYDGPAEGYAALVAGLSKAEKKAAKK